VIRKTTKKKKNKKKKKKTFFFSGFLIFFLLFSGSESGSFLKRGGSRLLDSVDGNANILSSHEERLSQVESACVRLANLALKLGETFMASDLTALLSLKKNTVGGPRTADSKALQARVQLDEQKPLNKNILEFRNSKGYVIKMIILDILALVSAETHADDYFDPPVNLILTELVAARKNRFLVNDDQYRIRLFHVLSPYANKVEGFVCF
jgi:hypothetical protein